MSDPFAPIAGKGKRANLAVVPPAMAVMMPVPTEAPAPPQRHPTLGQPILAWTYTDTAGRVLGYVHRYEKRKQFRPLTLWRHAAGSALEWRWKSWPPKRPLYGLARLTEKPTAPVVVCEGEKSADAAQRLLPGFAAVTSPNGSKSAGKADWTPLHGRDVTIWPDADAAGLDYARAVAKAATEVGAASVVIVSPPADAKVGWDGADALAEGWDQARASTFVAAAVQWKEESKRPRHRGKGDNLIGAVINTDDVELWRDVGGGTYATVPVKDHLENWPLKSEGFRRWLAGLNYQRTGFALSNQVLEDVNRTLDIKAYSEGRQYDPFVRVGQQAGRLYLDLCDDRWRSVEIAANGWALIERPPIKFLRSPSARPLPEPEAGDRIERLRNFVNVASDDDFMLIVAWLVAALRPGRPFPILIINGTEGSGKTFLCKMLRLLIDPDAALLIAVPKDERDLVLGASNTWISAFDNLSEMKGYLPDALCRLASGGGFRTRALHTNRDEAVFTVQRPALFNGIPTLTEQADMTRRSITINLTSIAADQRQAEDDLWKEFERVRPCILGALLDAASCALRNVEKVRLVRPSSMADFEKWLLAASPALGWENGQFEAAYRRNQSAVADETFESDAVAVAIYDFVTKKHLDGWEGSPTDLLDALDNHTPERIRKSRSWPKTAAQLGNRVKRAKLVLEHKGFTVQRRHSGTRSIILVPPVVSQNGAAAP